ncbi:glycosyltransferase family 2 protein [Acinetobacter baumannii]|uniref:glycosyltransferase family 2 protein n=1 Tax=Acinetobacter baumannii TaxID=470 RepID=UPI0029566D8B|nr:glycosyltransferase family 2 protein [Acinetobacter baumannii]
MDFIPDGISVVIPTYNRAHLIKESLQSVLAQTVQPLEIIVVDDFSTDNTEEVVKSLNSPLIKYFKNQRKKGANGARNTGIILSRGEFIAFHDSDDTWLPDKLELQKQVLRNDPNIDMCFCSLRTENSIVIPKRKIKSSDIGGLLKLKNFISTQTIFIYRKQALFFLFDEDLRRFQDWDFVLRVSTEKKIYHLDKPLVIQKLQLGSITNTVNYLESYEKIYEKYPNLYNYGIYNKVICKEIELKKQYAFNKVLELFFFKVVRRLNLFFGGR